MAFYHRDTPAGMRITLIHNPTSGDESHDSGSLHALLEGAGHDVRYQSVKEDGWERSLDEPGDLVLAAGGDGTVRKVFKEVPAGKSAVSVLPLGSANNIARTLGLAGQDVERLIAGLDRGTRRRYDLGEASTPAGTARFVESFGGGVFVSVLERAEDVDADGNEKVEVGLRLLRDVLEETESLPWELEVDGGDSSGAFLAVELMNIRETGANIPLAPRADPGDGLFDVVPIRPDDRAGLLAYLNRRLEGAAVESEPPALPVLRGARVRLRPPPTRPLRIDDQVWSEGGPSRWGDEVVVTAAAATVDLVIPSL
jgi:diacylglycerol kinase (ATP)